DNFVEQLTFCGKHQDGSLDSLLPEVAAHIQSTAMRQHHVEHDEIERPAGGSFVSRGSIRNRLDTIAFSGQSIGERQNQTWLVFNEENTPAGHLLILP